jgi:hypothetical protein
MPPYTGGQHAHPWPPTAAAAVGVLGVPPAPAGYRYTATWPVDDLNATLPNLIRHAEAELEVMAAADHVLLCGPTTWSLDRPPGRLLLTAVTPAQAMPGRDRRELPWDDRDTWARAL